MKKILLFISVILLANISVEAKDYAKIQIQEMKKAQKYNTTARYYEDYTSTDNNLDKIDIKDPKLLTLSGYEQIPSDKFKEKIAKDNQKYEKIKSAFMKHKTDNFNVQGYGSDYYKIYRVAERLIRANNFDYINWKITLANNSSFNAAAYETNSITINTGALDTLSSNEDALALLIGHEMAHAQLGHLIRLGRYNEQISHALRSQSLLLYIIQKRRALSADKKMEYAADTNGAIYAARAGYDLSKAKETLSIINTLSSGYEFNQTHPNGKNRLRNYAETRKDFLEEEWSKQGAYNIYKSDVLPVSLSSDRKSIVIEKAKGKTEANSYKTEDAVDMFTRLAYKSYLRGDFKRAEKFFGSVLDIDKSNPMVYLYFSYTEECLYKQTGNAKYLENAKIFAAYAQKLAPDNKYIKEQVEAL